ncbi:MAG: hypothetical protein KDE55_00680 [Novosphingobium sp.]|nr:hypothetical protein [Novosphingobium sp.]
MYEFIDRPVTDLDHGGRFLVWSMRMWVRTVGDRACPASRIAPAFAKWKMIAGLQPFNRTMILFNRDGLVQFGFCALPCNHVSEHEAILLSLVCALADRRPQDVRDTLAMLVDEDAIGDLIAALSELGRAMDAAGIFPVRPMTAASQPHSR